ncbi:Flp family type IVb pilin [Fulvimarina endophytica]|uniref:Flp family type IVb pilin n=1 Tax=Fulvimarina endophytica TaxID=2293836 RepID=UPI0011C0625C|nr:Flp family type IVb pilin [Fulvimarina endophytica]
MPFSDHSGIPKTANGPARKSRPSSGARLSALMADRAGAAAIEYALIGGVMAIALFAALTELNLAAAWQGISNSVKAAIGT